MKHFQQGQTTEFSFFDKKNPKKTYPTHAAVQFEPMISQSLNGGFHAFFDPPNSSGIWFHLDPSTNMNWKISASPTPPPQGFQFFILPIGFF